MNNQSGLLLLRVLALLTNPSTSRVEVAAAAAVVASSTYIHACASNSHVRSVGGEGRFWRLSHASPTSPHLLQAPLTPPTSFLLPLPSLCPPSTRLSTHSTLQRMWQSRSLPENTPWPPTQKCIPLNVDHGWGHACCCTGYSQPQEEVSTR